MYCIVIPNGSKYTKVEWSSTDVVPPNASYMFNCQPYKDILLEFNKKYQSKMENGYICKNHNDIIEYFEKLIRKNCIQKTEYWEPPTFFNKKVSCQYQWNTVTLLKHGREMKFSKEGGLIESSYYVDGKLQHREKYYPTTFIKPPEYVSIDKLDDYLLKYVDKEDIVYVYGIKREVHMSYCNQPIYEYERGVHKYFVNGELVYEKRDD